VNIYLYCEGKGVVIMISNERREELDKACKDITSENDKITLRALKVLSRTSEEEVELFSDNVKVIISLLTHTNNEIVAYTCWTIGQIGFKRPELVGPAVEKIKLLINDEDAGIREYAIWALGRIGRSKVSYVSDFIPALLTKTKDPEPRIRMNCIWACENIATNYPDLFKDYIPVFIELLSDSDTKYVRPEAPEIFRVIGSIRPQLVECAIPVLEEKLNDDCRVTCIHSRGALKAIKKAISLKSNKS
jgi:vesicle coat complex subunit